MVGRESNSMRVRNRVNRVGKYELGRVLGEGSFGKVHLGVDVESGEKRAIKVVHKERVVKDKMMIEQVKREIFNMKLVRHPNVINLFEVLASKNKIYLVLEYVNGGELFKKVTNKGKLGEDDARKYFQQLINAVDHCHKKGVYHRDLKLENLLLDEDGNVKISDFGLSALSQQVRGDGLLHTTCGTPNYVAPEVIVDKGYDGVKADLWSCGVVLYVLLAGYFPFDEPNLINLYKKILKADFTCPKWFSSPARRIILGLLEPNPKNRIDVPCLLECSWFKKGYKPANFMEQRNVDCSDVELLFSNLSDDTMLEKREAHDQKPLTLNAFHIISLSEGLNLSGLFEKEQGCRREMRFALRCPASDIMEKMEEKAKPMGFSVCRRNSKVWMRLEKTDENRRENLSISTEVFEVSPSLSVVEMKKAGGDMFQFEKHLGDQMVISTLDVQLSQILDELIEKVALMSSSIVKVFDEYHLIINFSKKYLASLKDLLWTPEVKPVD